MNGPYVGAIGTFPYAFEPKGWARCEGQILQISGRNVRLFSLIGNRYGGDGRATFALPRMPRLPTLEPDSSLGYFIALEGIMPEQP